MPTSVKPSLLTRSLAAAAAIFALAALTSASAAPGTSVPPGAARLALSALGDLSPFRRIAADTLVLVDKGDMTAARARVKELETAWDKAEATLKPKDKATWTKLDGMIDAALADLRTPNPTPATCAASLKALVSAMDTVDRA